MQIVINYMKAVNRQLFAALCFVPAIILFYTLYNFNPLENAFYPPCFFKKVTGLNCPGCGSARALYALLHGRLLQACGYNLLTVLFIPIIICGLISYFTNWGHKLWSKLNKPAIYFIVICIFFVLRNINVYPFTFLNADK